MHNTYSFALYPEGYHPTGSVDYSRVDSTTFDFYDRSRVRYQIYQPLEVKCPVVHCDPEAERDMDIACLFGAKELGKCSVCLEAIETELESKTLDCDHTFHRLCIDGWLEKCATKSCPRCYKSPFERCECSICLEFVETQRDAKTLPCSHTFHRICIAEWLEKAAAKTCPLCRRAAESEAPQAVEFYPYIYMGLPPRDGISIFPATNLISIRNGLVGMRFVS
jgi:hypothetical protein